MDIHYDYDRFGCRHTLLSIVSLHRVTSFFLVCLFVFFSLPLPVSFFLFLSRSLFLLVFFSAHSL